MPDFQENPAHPLFPPDDDDDDSPAALISEIVIQRVELGKKVTCPRMFRGEELMSLADLAALYGGGEYELIGRHNNRITGRRRYTIPGPNKPMYEGVLPSAEPPQPVPQTPTDPMSAMMGGQGGGIMPILMMMFQQQNQAADRQTQMFIAMMQGTRESSAEEKAQARLEMQQNIERERINAERQMAMMREVLSSKGGGSGEDFVRGVEYMRGFAQTQIETLKAAANGDGNSELGSLLETLGQAFQAAQSVGMFKSAPEAVAQAAEVVQ